MSKQETGGSDTHFRETETAAYHAYREWPVLLMLRKKELEGHLAPAHIDLPAEPPAPAPKPTSQPEPQPKPKEVPAPVKDSVVAGTCPKCGGNLIRRSGPHGSFTRCANFPTCKGTVGFVKPVVKQGKE